MYGNVLKWVFNGCLFACVRSVRHSTETYTHGSELIFTEACLVNTACQLQRFIHSSVI